jgi:hypothetical protein
VRILTFSPAMKVVRHPLKRFYGRHDLHFVTFSCFRRRPYLGTVRARNRFVSVLKEVRAQRLCFDWLRRHAGTRAPAYR